MKSKTVLRAAGVALAVMVATGILAAQQLPATIYGDSLEERCHALTEGVDGGYCLAGWSRSFGMPPPLNHKILVVKTDADGVPVWATRSMGELDEEAHSMCMVADGYVLTGWTQNYGIGAPNKNLILVKLGINGGVQWARAWGWEADDEGYSVVPTMDGGYAVAGLTASFGPPPHPNVLVGKFAPDGSLQWARVYWTLPTHFADEGYAIVQTQDSGYAVVGRANVTSPTTFDPFVFKIDPRGMFQWGRFSPGMDADDEGHSAIYPGQIMVGGWTKSYGTAPLNKADMFVAKFGPTGSLTWSKTYGWSGGDEQLLEDRSLAAAHDGGIAACGPTTSVGPGTPNPNFLLMKLDPGGVVQWCRSHPSPYRPGLQSDVARPMIQTSRHDYAAAGWSNSYPELGGLDDFHLVVVDSMGDRPVCVEPQDPTVDTMPWAELSWADSIIFLEPEEFPLEPVEVLYADVCEETTAVREGRVVPRPDETKPQLLPSPASGVVRVAGLVSPARLVLFDASGREAARFELAGRREERLDISRLAAGVYLARFEGREGTSHTRLLVR